MTPLDNILIVGQKPLYTPKPLMEWLNRMNLQTNCLELFGPNIYSGSEMVYGYFIPEIKCIIQPLNCHNSEAMSHFTGTKEFSDYILTFGYVIKEALLRYCHLNDSDNEVIYTQTEDESDKEFYKRLEMHALSTDYKSIAYHFKTDPNRHLSWKDIWNIFQITKYDLRRVGNYLIETSSFILYLHLPQYEKINGEKIIFRHNCNNPDERDIDYVLLSEAENPRHRNNNDYKLLSFSESMKRLMSKPVIKFDGEYFIDNEKMPNFGYRFDGVYKAGATNSEGNIILDVLYQ